MLLRIPGLRRLGTAPVAVRVRRHLAAARGAPRPPARSPEPPCPQLALRRRIGCSKPRSSKSGVATRYVLSPPPSPAPPTHVAGRVELLETQDVNCTDVRRPWRPTGHFGFPDASLWRAIAERRLRRQSLQPKRCAVRSPNLPSVAPNGGWGSVQMWETKQTSQRPFS